MFQVHCENINIKEKKVGETSLSGQKNSEGETAGI